MSHQKQKRRREHGKAQRVLLKPRTETEVKIRRLGTEDEFKKILQLDLVSNLEGFCLTEVELRGYLTGGTCLLAVSGREIVGYLVYERQESALVVRVTRWVVTRKPVGGTLKDAVAEERFRQKIVSRLIELLAEMLSPTGYTYLTVAVPLSDKGACKFFASARLKAILTRALNKTTGREAEPPMSLLRYTRVLHGHYKGKGEDAVVYRFELQGGLETSRHPGGDKPANASGGVLDHARDQAQERNQPAGAKPNKEEIRVHIRWMIRRDMPEVLQTEQDSFEYPWTEEDFLRCLGQRNCIGMVAERGEKVVAYMIYELCKAHLHVLNFAVCPSVRRAGVGARMIDKLISKLSSHRRTRITLEVRESNLAAQLFFRRQGLKAKRVLPDYYEDRGEDAFLMQYTLAGSKDDVPETNDPVED